MKTKKTLFLSTAILILVLITCCRQEDVMGKEVARKRTEPLPSKFGIYWSTVDGKNFTEVLTDPKRCLNHARVSNDHKWITFTRFNKISPTKGLALEEEGYKQTEIMVCRIDGSDLQTLVPPKKGCINGNGYWMPDNKEILYVSTDTPNKMPGLVIINLETKQKRRVPVPEGYFPTDPHIVDDMLIFPATTKTMKKTAIFTMKKDGTTLKRITNALGQAENDPKLSPDKSKAVLFRNVRSNSRVPIIRANEWHTIVVDLKTGEEKDISPPGTIDGVAEWSSDGKLLVLWQLNMAQRLEKVRSLPPTKPIPAATVNLFIVRPDGSGRKKVPLPDGYYTMPAFFPGTGSGENAKIIFSARTFAGRP